MARTWRRTIYRGLTALVVSALAFYLLGFKPEVDWNAVDYDLGPGADAVFDPKKLLTFSLELKASDWHALQRKAKAEEYVPAQLRVGTEFFGEVGLRFKGARDSLRDLVLNPQRMPKLSFKIRFDKYRKGARFHGLRRINLHAMHSDPSLLRDRLSYHLLRKFGVPTPRCTHAQVVINGQLKGLFALVEQVDEVFAKTQFGGTGKGQLYKEAWPTHLDGAYYAAHLKSSKKRGDHSRMTAFAHALLAKDDARLVREASRYVDLEAILRYLVASDAIGNWDSASCWTGDRDRGFHNQNYYWYLDQKASRLRLIAWDLDQSLRPRTPIQGLPTWRQTDIAPDEIYSKIGTTHYRAAAADPLCRALALFAAGRHGDLMSAFVAGPMAQAETDVLLEAWAGQIRAAVADDRSLPGGFGFRRLWLWEARVVELRQNLAELRRMALGA